VGTYPAWSVSFAPGIPSSDVPDLVDWVDLTARLDVDRSTLDVMTGREDADSDFAAGTARLVLDNSDGDLDPDNIGGTWYGQLLPLTWFRIMAGTTTADAGVFYGQVTMAGWQITATQFPDTTVTVDLVDASEQLANIALPESVWAMAVEALSPKAWWRLGESSGTVMVDSSGNGHHGTYLSGDAFNSRAGLLPYSSDGAIEFSESDGAIVDLIEQPGAALTTYPFSVIFASDEAAFDAPPPYTSGPSIWQQFDSIDGSGFAGGGSMYIQHLGSAGAAVGAVDNALAFAVSDGTNYRRWTSASAVFDGEPHLFIVTVVDADNVVLYVDGVGVTMSLYASAGSAPDPQGGAGLVRLAHTPNDSVMLDEVVLVADSIDSLTAADLASAAFTPWEGDLSGARAIRLLDAIGYPAAARAADTGYSTLQATALGTDVLSALREVARAERGELYVDHRNTLQGVLTLRSRRYRSTYSVDSQATFGDGAGEVTYDAIVLQDARIANHAAVQRVGGATITARDATSEAQYQTRSRAETSLVIDDDTEARHRAELIVAEGKDRRRRVRSITLEPRDSSHPAWAEVFERRIGERILVKWQPSYGGTYSFPSYIEGIAHSWNAHSGLRTTFYLSPVPYGAEAEPYWLAGVSTAGETTRPGY
jgi:hypothetical protein